MQATDIVGIYTSRREAKKSRKLIVAPRSPKETSRLQNDKTAATKPPQNKKN
jgi:hypothetical protein